VRETWDKYWGKIETLNVERVIGGDAYYRLLKRLIDLPRDKDLRILEVGCGSGIRTLALLKEFWNHSLNATLIDFSPIALAFAKKNADENGITANFALADALKLPFADESFDIVWNEGVNEHFDGAKRQLTFNGMARICKRGGQIIVIVPNALNLPYRLWKKVLEIKGRWEYGFEKPYSIFELKNKMKNAGLIPTQVGGMTVVGSFFHLAELLLRKSSTKSISAQKRMVHSRVLSKAYHRIERILEKTLWFAGADIGVKGIKCG
jgi:ubiquinone/menaquinone biosynthesis C-methylase UbiE